MRFQTGAKIKKYLIAFAIITLCGCKQKVSSVNNSHLAEKPEQQPKPPSPITEEDLLACDRHATTSDYFTKAEERKRDELQAKNNAEARIDRIVGELREGESAYGSAHLDSSRGRLFINKYKNVSPVKSLEFQMKITRVVGGVLVDCESQITLYRRDDGIDSSYEIPVVGKLAR